MEQVTSLWGKRANNNTRILRYLAITCLLLLICLWLKMLSSLELGFQNLDIDFLIHQPNSGGREGGILSIIVSTAIIIAITLAAALPISLFIAWNLSENQNSYIAKWTSTALDLLAGMPSIVFGLCGNAIFVRYFGMGYSLLSGGLTLAIMILPLATKVMQQQFESFSKELRLNCIALGLGPAERLLKFQLPQSIPAIGTMIVLGIARSMSETAALLLTSGFVDRIPESLTDSGRSLSVHIYDLAMNVPGAMSMAMSSAWVLIFILIFLNFSLAWTLKPRTPNA